MEKLKLQTLDLAVQNEQNLITLIKEANLFPNCITETLDPKTGKIKRAIDFDLLRQELSNEIVEGPQERYRLDWPGKREALALANAPIRKTLRPCKDESVDFDTTQNLYIEGDNLDALKLLQETYLGKVKMIYIDPPYNTGNDFIYDDDFSMSSEEYEGLAGARDEEGNAMFQEEKWKQNSAASGRFHSEWLSMMYPRLRLGRNLLREDGVIFISIDHGELANLCRLCDEVFGPDNFCGIFVWEKKKKPSFLNANMGTVTDYIVAYARSRPSSPPFAAGTVEDGKKYPFNNAGNSKSILRFPSGSVQFTCADQTIKAQDMSEGNIVTELLDDVIIKNGKNVNEFRLLGEWRYSQTKLDEFVKNGDEILISKVPFRPNYINRSGAIKKTANFLSHRTNGVPTNEDATEEIRDLFGKDLMSYPKPTGLLKFLTRAVTSNDDLVIDFFAGSGTTADAVMRLNREDGGRRRYIMIQLPEPCEDHSEAFKYGLSTIAEVGKERIRRAGKKILEEWLVKGASSAEHLQLEAEHSDANPPDIGFRVLKIDSSNMADVYYQPDELTQDSLMLQVDNLKSGRKPEDLLFQLLLDWGVDLALPIIEETILKHRVFFVADNALAACFDTGLDEAFVKELAKRQPLRAVFRDSSYANDAVKINFEQIFKALSPHTELKTI